MLRLGTTSMEDPTRAVEWARELASAAGLVSEAIGPPVPRAETATPAPASNVKLWHFLFI
jgi:hypothetical protein